MRRNPFNPIDYLVPWLDDENPLDPKLPVTTVPPVEPPGGQPAGASPNYMSSGMPFPGQSSGGPPANPPQVELEKDEYWGQETTWEQNPLNGEWLQKIKMVIKRRIPPEPAKEAVITENVGGNTLTYSVPWIFDKTSWKWVQDINAQKQNRASAMEALRLNIPNPGPKTYTFNFDGIIIKKQINPLFNKETMSYEYGQDAIDKAEDNARLEYNIKLVADAGRRGDVNEARRIDLDTQKTLGDKLDRDEKIAERIQRAGETAKRLGLDENKFKADEEQRARDEARQSRNEQIAKQEALTGRYFKAKSFLDAFNKGQTQPGAKPPLSWEDFQALLPGSMQGQPQPEMWGFPAGRDWMVGSAQRKGLFPIKPEDVLKQAQPAPPSTPTISSNGGPVTPFQGPVAPDVPKGPGLYETWPGTEADLVPFHKAGFYQPTSAQIQSNIARNQAISNDPYEQRLFPLKMQLQRFDAPAMGTPEQNTLLSQMDAIRKEQTSWQEAERLKRDKEAMAENEKQTMYNQKLLFPGGRRQPNRPKSFFQR